MASEDILYKTALDAIEKGERRRAKDLLTRLLRSNKNNPDYWVWMSTVVETSKESVFCLKEALKLDPEHENARRGLIMAGELPIDPKMVIPLEQQRRNWETQYIAPTTRMQKFANAPLWVQIASAGGVLIVLAALITLTVRFFGIGVFFQHSIGFTHIVI